MLNDFCLLLRGQSTTFLWPFRGCLHSRHFLVVFSPLWDCCPVVSGTWETGEAKKRGLYITNSRSSTYIGKGMTIKKIVQIRRFWHRLSMKTVIINWWCTAVKWCKVPGVVGGTSVTTILLLYCLFSKASALGCFSSMVFIAAGVFS